MATNKKSTSSAAPKKAANGGSTKIQTNSEMKTSEIRDLIDFIAQSGLNEVDIETKELKIHVKRERDQNIVQTAAAPAMIAAPAQQQQVAATQPVAAQLPAAVKTEKPVAASRNTADIKSPMIGTFYRSTNPDTPPFVSVGDKVTKGQTVCIIEAMKLFNEIESEVSGTIVKVMAENATPVEYDQVLFVVEPD
jgi:acetyl-CoA carboxylase biotin carboxyl carrier protein